MNKNLFKTLAIAAMAVLAGACAKEQVASGDGETVEMTFNVDVPETTITTKGLSDAAQVDELVFDAFRNLNDTESIKGLRQVVAVENGRATIQVKLVKGQNYRFVFWAQKANNGYYNTDNLSNITVDYKNALANDSSLDAFFAKEEVTNVQNPISKTIILKRPFAQVNYVTKEELSEGLYIKESQITVKNALTSFNPLRNKLSGAQDVTFNYNAVPAEKLIIGGIEYNYLATAFILAKSDRSKDIVDVEAKFKANKGYSVTVSTPGLPCQRNYRTNVIGNFMSVDGTYNVEIDSAFKGDFQSDYVANALSSGQVVTLTEDYSLPEGSGSVAVPSGKTSVLNLNGKKFSNENGYKENKAALQVHGGLTINGDGEVYCEGGADNNAIIVEQGGHLVINGGTYNVGANTNSGKSNATIFVMGPDKYGRNGSVEINGGVFMAEAGSDGTPFVLNQHDDITVNCFSVKGGTFVGFNPAEVNENKGAITSFVAEGYKSVETTYNGKPAWEVVDASVSVADQSEFEKTLSDLSGTDDVIIKLGTGNFEFKKSGYSGNITLKGAGIGKTVVTSNTYYENNGVTISLENLTFDSKNPYVGDAQLCQFLRSDIAFTNCEINGVVGVMALKSATFTGCTFKNSTNSGFTGYSIIYYGYDKSTVTVDDCKFETTGKAICLYGTAGIYNLVVKDCEFLTSNKDKAAIQIHTDYTNGDAASTLMRGNVNITNTTVSGFNGIWWEGLNDKTPKVPTKYFTITIDGTTVQTAE